nr:hypothetical protein B0A51_11707 [Rachicladosporium sp. CCFEE 5018]
MEFAEAQDLIGQLTTGFDTLQEEYQKLAGRHQALERQLETARTQYNELAKLCGSASLATPPLSLTSASNPHTANGADPSAGDLIALQSDSTAEQAARRVRDANSASRHLLRKFPSSRAPNVQIWGGSSGEATNSGRCMMPSITESPLERDFTVEGTPSRLGCPFASMSGRPLSSHAASVLSRYKSGGSAVSPADSIGPGPVNRIDGRVSFSSRRGSRRGSIADPIKAEICGLSDHRDSGDPTLDVEEHNVNVETATGDAEAGVCPIRFLDQHSPEEVATYFEKHKHQLPRSHEICVKRYQTNEAQIRELDSKYGNLVSMIQGLGAKHQPMLPPEPDEAVDVDEVTALDDDEADKVRRWASHVSSAPVEAMELEDDGTDEPLPAEAGGEERQSHFERPLRDIRVGESPSRPWGLTVPARFLEKDDHANQPDVDRSVSASKLDNATAAPIDHKAVHTGPNTKSTSAAKCPFDFSKLPSGPLPGPDVSPAPPAVRTAPSGERHGNTAPAFIAPGIGPERDGQSAAMQPRSVFTGPVFIGYSADDAIRILRESGLGNGTQ